MKIYSWNVNGIRAVLRNGFMDWFNKVKPDILCIQEIKAQEDTIPDEIKKIPGYNLYFSAADKRGYAGTAVLSKGPAMKVENNILSPEFYSEGRLQFVEFEKFYLLNTYFPNTQPDLKRLDFKMKFNEEYLKFVNKKRNKPLILTGDFNVAHREIDLARPKQNVKNAGFTPEERAFAEKLIIENGWHDTFREFYPKEEKYSWWTYRFGARSRNVGWRIDYFLVRGELIKKVKKAEIHNDVMGSDHCPISIEIEI